MAVANAVCAAEANPCKLAPIDQWATRANYRSPIVDGSINGRPIRVLLDTGAAVSLIYGPVTSRLGLNPFPIKGGWISGIGGERRLLEVHIDEFRIADHARKDWVAFVTAERNLSTEVEFLLGYDFFHQMDVEFDLPSNVVRLHQAIDCESTSLAYWTSDASALPLESHGRIEFTVSINGRPFTAWLDSGASTSLLSRSAAALLGVTPDTTGVVSGGCVRGIGATRFDSWIGAFESFAVGNEIIHDARIAFTDLWRYSKVEVTGSHIPRAIERLPDMLLGADFLRSHRVLVAHSQSKMYFSYSGGPVFPVRAGRPCSATKNYGAPAASQTR